LLAAELPRLTMAVAAWPLQYWQLAGAPRGDDRPILIIPGFGASDRSTAMLRRYLNWLGYDARGWGLGNNIGAKTVGIHNEVLVAKLDQIHAETGRPVTLIGWSMGGIMARMIARERPGAVAELILLGSPFASDPYANRAWKLYERISGHSLSHPVAQRQIAQSKLPPPVKSTSLYSKSDGVVAWECCIEPPAPHTRNIEVSTSHCAFAFNPHVLRLIADLLRETQP
jgi:triacylglycerol lipase